MSEETDKRLAELEELMGTADFWTDKEQAQKLVREYQDLKAAAEGGCDDAEDFANMLLKMYQGYAQKKGWNIWELHANENDHGGYRNVLVEISGKGVYGRLKHESGVHRLVRISPFNANAK